MVLTNFNAALERHKAEIGQSKLWRYKGGRLPAALRFIVQRPDLAVALAEDAMALSRSADATRGGEATC